MLLSFLLVMEGRGKGYHECCVVFLPRDPFRRRVILESLLVG